MPRLKRLSGAEVVAILVNFGFQVYSQKGSHIKLRRQGIAGK
ncbi:type II toxin-antitoxin system HicA family toxin [[Phormidium] sp. LEGE 05292]|nr:type II toxin-antitoxin system HicA family toxin [Phormidium sp. LEGE 05292]